MDGFADAGANMMGGVTEASKTVVGQGGTLLTGMAAPLTQGLSEGDDEVAVGPGQHDHDGDMAKRKRPLSGMPHDTSMKLNLLPASKQVEIRVTLGNGGDGVGRAQVVGPSDIVAMINGQACSWGSLDMPDHAGGEVPPGTSLKMRKQNFYGKTPTVGMVAYAASEGVTKKKAPAKGVCLGQLTRMDAKAGTFQTNRKCVVTDKMAVVFYQGGVALDHDLRTRLSPLQDVTLPEELRESKGIPASAVKVGYFYPVAGLERGLEELHFGKEDAWAFLLLLGGTSRHGVEPAAPAEPWRMPLTPDSAIAIAPRQASSTSTPS